jgi:hypothetical protein
MSKQIFNGGIEAGILQIVGRENLNEVDIKRLDYLESLPKNQWINLDEKGKAITENEALENEITELTRYGIKLIS